MTELRLDYIYVNPRETIYNYVGWEFNSPNDRVLILSIYASKGRIECWANGYKNNQYQMAVL